MLDTLTKHTALTAPNRFVKADGRRLAYRTFGQGPNLVLAVRFRGTMDVWDPLFLDQLAEKFTVTVFDYRGLGLSTGEASYAKLDMAQDILDLIDGLGFDKVVLGGWSIGGHAVQVFTALHPERVSHLVAIGTMPPGLMVKPFEDLFFQTAWKVEYGVEEEYILFFEPDSATSRRLADASLARIAAREEVRDVATPAEVFIRSVEASSDPTTPFPDPDGAYADFFRTTDIPVMALSGDHDIIFPVENWYAVNDQWPTLFVVTFPDSGHGPQHQYPVMAAEMIASFVNQA
ncbi:alpha/beta fold hydrolase [Aurantiacibacter hainanensis]|uniref:alpha/beta fold hydrolase n=1 Tax=Aurantiacibacter hainanensis TaxID=3076114 RepID=UPI0030C6800B